MICFAAGADGHQAELRNRWSDPESVSVPYEQGKPRPLNEGASTTVLEAAVVRSFGPVPGPVAAGDQRCASRLSRLRSRGVARAARRPMASGYRGKRRICQNRAPVDRGSSPSTSKPRPR
jgi:hypothetical protein